MSATGTVSREQTQQKLDLRGPVAARYMASTPYTTADRLEDCARDFGERIFLTEGDVRYTYAQLNQHANQVARALHAQGVKKGDVSLMQFLLGVGIGAAINTVMGLILNRKNYDDGVRHHFFYIPMQWPSLAMVVVCGIIGFIKH